MRSHELNIAHSELIIKSCVTTLEKHESNLAQFTAFDDIIMELEPMGGCTHGLIRAAAVVALRWKHRSFYEAPSAQGNQGATEKRSTNGAVASAGLHNR